jgi:hypothetical protein
LKKRLLQYRRQIGLCLFWGGVGLFYYILNQLTGFAIPCLFHKITGLSCPGCGVSRMAIRLFHLDFFGAAKENLAIACLLPLWIVAIFLRVLWNPSWFQKNSLPEKILLWGSIVVLLLFGIVRNLWAIFG